MFRFIVLAVVVSLAYGYEMNPKFRPTVPEVPTIRPFDPPKHEIPEIPTIKPYEQPKTEKPDVPAVPTVQAPEPPVEEKPEVPGYEHPVLPTPEYPRPNLDVFENLGKPEFVYTPHDSDKDGDEMKVDEVKQSEGFPVFNFEDFVLPDIKNLSEYGNTADYNNNNNNNSTDAQPSDREVESRSFLQHPFYDFGVGPGYGPGYGPNYPNPQPNPDYHHHAGPNPDYQPRPNPDYQPRPNPGYQPKPNPDYQPHPNPAAHNQGPNPNYHHHQTGPVNPDYHPNNHHNAQPYPAPVDGSYHKADHNVVEGEKSYYRLDTCEYRFILDMVQCHQEEKYSEKYNTHSTGHETYHNNNNNNHHHAHNGYPYNQQVPYDNRYTDFYNLYGNPRQYMTPYYSFKPNFVDQSLFSYRPSVGHPFYAPGLHNAPFARYYAGFRAGQYERSHDSERRSYHKQGHYQSALEDFNNLHLMKVVKYDEEKEHSEKYSSKVSASDVQAYEGVTPAFDYHVRLLPNHCSLAGYPGKHTCIVFSGATHPYKMVHRQFIYVKNTREIMDKYRFRYEDGQRVDYNNNHH